MVLAPFMQMNSLNKTQTAVLILLLHAICDKQHRMDTRTNISIIRFPQDVGHLQVSIFKDQPPSGNLIHDQSFGVYADLTAVCMYLHLKHLILTLLYAMLLTACAHMYI